MIRITGLLFLCTICLSACAGSNWVRTNVDKQYEFIVSLEQQEAGSAAEQKYAHPFNLDPAQLKKLLGDLTYTQTKVLADSDKPSPAFQTAEIERLTPALVDALAKASASQRVRFASYNQGIALVFPVSQKTEGVIFRDPAGRLNLAFSYLNSKRDANESSATAHRFSPVDPLQVETANASLSAPASYARSEKLADGKQAPLWVVADLDKMMDVADTRTVPAVTPKEAVEPVVAPKAQSKSTPAVVPRPTQTTEDKLGYEMKKKLKFLKELFEEGLISEKDYNSKKLELLEGI